MKNVSNGFFWGRRRAKEQITFEVEQELFLAFFLLLLKELSYFSKLGTWGL